MIKRMKHPVHGFTHVYDSGQEEQIRVHGWVEENEPFLGEQPEGKEVAPVVVEEAPQKKPGRRPRR